MIKIIFLTLVMILGMSSVSFGKKYLCSTKVGVAVIPTHGKNNTKEQRERIWVIRKMSATNFLVETDEYDTKMLSVYELGGSVEEKQQNHWCVTDKSNEYYTRGSKSHLEIDSQTGRVLSCRTTHSGSGEGRTYFEFIFELETMKFGSNSIIGIDVQLTNRGLCQDI
jgi:hypothetical protein